MDSAHNSTYQQRNASPNEAMGQSQATFISPLLLNNPRADTLFRIRVPTRHVLAGSAFAHQIALPTHGMRPPRPQPLLIDVRGPTPKRRHKRENPCSSYRRYRIEKRTVGLDLSAFPQNRLRSGMFTSLPHRFSSAGVSVCVKPSKMLRSKEGFPGQNRLTLPARRIRVSVYLGTTELKRMLHSFAVKSYPPLSDCLASGLRHGRMRSD